MFSFQPYDETSSTWFNIEPTSSGSLQRNSRYNQNNHLLEDEELLVMKLYSPSTSGAPVNVMRADVFPNCPCETFSRAPAPQGAYQKQRHPPGPSQRQRCSQGPFQGWRRLQGPCQELWGSQGPFQGRRNPKERRLSQEPPQERYPKEPSQGRCP
ncbi:uncharacterized protein LOC121855511 [Homarus americanus]|uniref:uncharacterized protein LOC121855511 n=1 Tax=Homarus americanus TaxID=6706 RepID=UPI001C483779|nr:uncharacterized protein LOC121855511 [Homarus americanus]